MDSAAPSRLTGMGGPIGMLVMDLAVPIAGYYALRAIGLEPVLALILAGVPTSVAIAYRAIRRRKVDALGIFVLTVLAGSVALTFVTGSPRFLLAKEGWFTAAIGTGFLVTLWFARPPGLLYRACDAATLTAGHRVTPRRLGPALGTRPSVSPHLAGGDRAVGCRGRSTSWSSTHRTSTKRLADTMVDYWTTFAHTDDPYSANTPPWPRFTGDGPVLWLDQYAVRPAPYCDEHRCGFWQRLRLD